MKSELLAPAGSFEALRAAVSCKADAVYIGAEKFSARQNAENFGPEKLKEAVRYCHIRGVRVYLAINTLIGDSELDEAFETAKYAYEIGIDAFIVQDLGLVKLFIEKFDIPVHASTQMTVFDENGLRFLKNLGVSRAVLSRECRKNEIERMAKADIMELEVFCHGAVCMCYSGQCLMSSMIGGRSANRGLCAQPCRLPYSIDKKSGYFLSPKDLCLADDVKELMNMGISSLKIEGRMKSPAYVASAVTAYRGAMDNGKCSLEDYDKLLKAFSRGGSFTRGCYGAEKGEKMMNIHSSNENAAAGADREFVKSLSAMWQEGKELKKIPVTGDLTVNGDITEFTLSDKEITVSEKINTVKEKRGHATDCKFAEAQLSKLGQTPYEMESFSCSINAEAYFSASELNSLRRKAAEKLSYARTGKRKFKGSGGFILRELKIKEEFYIAASVETKEQARALVKAGARVYAPYYINYTDGVYAEIIPAVYEKLPREIKTDTVLAGSIGAAEYAKSFGKKVIADYSMNIYNSLSASMFDKAVLSCELTKDMCKKISKYCQTEVVSYGYLPVMISRNCVINSSGKCDKDCRGCRKSIWLKDRKGAEFKVKSNGFSNVIYNSVPIFMADKKEDILKTGASGIRLMFTSETPEECVRIYKMYSGESPVELPKEYTRGHFYRGV